MTVAFLVWYLLYVLLSTYAVELMSTPVIGDVNLGLLISFGQFVTTFLLTWLYVRHANRSIDPKAEAVAGADVVLVLTEWDEFAHADPARLRALVASPQVVDARHCLDERAWRAAGWSVHGLAPAREAPAEPRAQDALVPA